MDATATQVRFLHSSDWQLGMTRAFLDDEAAARFAQARIDAIGTLGRLATEHHAGFIVVAGDVFESNQLSRQTLMRTLNALESLPVPIFLLPGNHDPLDGTSIFSTAEFLEAGEHIIVLRNTTPAPVPGMPDVEVVGAPWRTRHPGSDLVAELSNQLTPAEGVTRIAVAHGQVDTLAPDASLPELIDLAAAEQAISDDKFHYLALGDRHSVTCVGSTGRVRYSGAPVATAFDEVDPNKALLVELTGNEACNVQPLVVGAWSFIAEQRLLNGPEDLEQLSNWLTSLPDKERTVLKIGFEGSLNLATAAELDALMESRADLFGGLWQRQSTSSLAIVPDEFDQDSVALAGYARSTWNELLHAAGTGDTTAQDALRLFYRVSGQQFL